MILGTVTGSRPTSIFLGACAPCLRPVRITDTGATGRYATTACPECGHSIRAERVHAVSSVQPCDGRCMGAVGPACSCSCEGENHGASFGALKTTVTEETESALAAYRERIAAQEAEAVRRRQRAADRKARVLAEWKDDNSDIADYLADPAAFGYDSDDPNGFLEDMAFQLRRGDILTERQADAVRRCIAGRERYRAAIEAEKATARPVPTGEALTVEGTIVHVKIEDNPFGSGGRYSMLVKGDGWKVWATIPSAVRSQADNLNDLKGRPVRFVATVTASTTDPSMGYAKRPRRAELLTAATTN